METGSTERVSGDWKGRDGNVWSFVGTERGPMIEVVRIEPDGRILIAPHATSDDLRHAVEVLAELYRQRITCACISHEVIIDVPV